MINDRKQDLDLLIDKELQIKELVSAHTWDIKKLMTKQMKDGVQDFA
jgi:hypothetical protein